MRRLIWTLVFLIVSVWIGLKIADDPGLALFSWRQWSVEMPLWFAAACLIFLMFIFYLVLRFFNGIGSSWRAIGDWFRWRSKNKAITKTNRGLLYLLEGQWKAAESNLNKGLEQSDSPLINYLAAAKAAHEQGEFNRRDEYLQRASQMAPNEKIVIAVTQAQLQLKQGDAEHALITLNQVIPTASKHPMVLKLLERIYVHLADWNNLLKLLPSLRKAKIANNEYLNKLETSIYEEQLKSVAQKTNNKETIYKTWQSIPKQFQKNPRLIHLIAIELFQYKDIADDLEKMIYKALNSQWDADLAKIYGILETSNPKKQLSHAESLLKQYQTQPVMLLTLGRLCVRNQLWGKARHYFEDSLALEPLPETYSEYVILLEQLGDTAAASKLYQTGFKTPIK